MRKKDKKFNKYVFCLFLIIIIFFAILINIKPKKDDDVISQQNETIEQIYQKENDNIIAQLQQLEERDRMEFYFGMFLENIENKNYDKAYSFLNNEFKNNYFPTVESFQEYISTIFTELSDIDHENIERNGEVYVLWIKVSDAINGKPGEKKEMNIVIKENDYNDFEMSFSVIK